jgi:hypothetical protein
MMSGISYNIIIMETQTKESMQQELAELEADLDTALEKYRELKEKIQALFTIYRCGNSEDFKKLPHFGTRE